MAKDPAGAAEVRLGLGPALEFNLPIAGAPAADSALGKDETVKSKLSPVDAVATEPRRSGRSSR